MRIVLGCDEAGFCLKAQIMAHLQAAGLEPCDCGVYDESPSLYPDTAYRVASLIQSAQYDRGILICGTGIGMAIAANKVPGVRAAVCHDVYSAQRARRSNNAQIMCLGARVIGPELAKALVDTWLQCEFSGGDSQQKVDRITYYEQLPNQL